MLSSITHLIEWISLWIESVIASTTYIGVALLMAIESCNIPLPSEVILTFAGYLVHDGKMNLHGAALAGAIGCVIGSVPSYWLGKWGGRSFLERYGKWILMTPHDLDVSEKWVARYGDWAFFICRMLPVVRTFISLPAGILHARFGPFVLFTFLGSWVWSYALVYAGVFVGQNKAAFKHLWHQFDALIIAVCFVLGILYIYKHVQHLQKSK
jgi:membrane protein DedA with SNARE-associated domain